MVYLTLRSKREIKGMLLVNTYWNVYLLSRSERGGGERREHHSSGIILLDSETCKRG